jgi:hypothetical protein
VSRRPSIEIQRGFTSAVTRVGVFLCLCLAVHLASAAAESSSWIVRFQSGVAIQRQDQILGQAGVRAGEIRRLRPPSAARLNRLAPDRSVIESLAVLQLEGERGVSGVIEDLAGHPAIAYVEPNYRLELAVLDQGRDRPAPALPRRSKLAVQPGTDSVVPIAPPSDFDFSLQWALQNTGQTEGEAGADIGALKAWSRETGSRDIVVAVIDTGIDFYHPDLGANLWRNPREVPDNGIDDDGNGYIDDVRGYDVVHRDRDPWDDVGHGTHVAGIIGAVGNNQLGVAGIAWQVSLMAVKVFDEDGGAELAHVVEGIRYAVANGAHILNASWGLTNRSQLLAEVMAEVRSAGVLVVAAAGNQRTDRPYYPAAYDSVMGVAATDHADRLAIFSSYGAWVSLSAPGQWIYSTMPSATYDHSSGTSMAAPHVAGVAALLLSRQPGLDPVSLDNLLRNSVDEIRSDRLMGAGRLNAARAMDLTGDLPVAQLRLPGMLEGVIDLRGTATGKNLAGYQLEYGLDRFPTNWTSFHQARAIVEDGPLVVGWNTADLPEGPLTIRLSVTNELGFVARDRAFVEVRNVRIDSPRNNDLLSPHQAVSIRGTVFGPNRRFRLEYGSGSRPTQWRTEGITLTHQGDQSVLHGELAVWNIRLLPKDTFYTLRLTAFEGSTTVAEALASMVYLEGRAQPGWPLHLPIIGNLPIEDWRPTVVADLDRDGFQELILVDPGGEENLPARLQVYSPFGTLRWERPLGTGFPSADLPVVGDIDGDGLAEVFADAGDQGLIYAFRHDGSPLPSPWPVKLEADNWGKVLADVDGDGQLELVVLSQGQLSQGRGQQRHLKVIDGRGTVRQAWSFSGCTDETDVLELLPVAANLDDDPELELVVIDGCDHLAVFDLTQPDRPRWRSPIRARVLASPVVGDLDADGHPEIVVVATATEQGSGGGVYVFDRGGRLWRNWPVLVDESFITPPALADLDADGDLEICAVSSSSKKLHVLHHSGFEDLPWPVGPLNSSAKTSPVIGDVDGDGHLDVVLASPGSWSTVVRGGGLSQIGGIKAWTRSGLPIDLNPAETHGVLPMESSGGPSTMKAAPVTLADLDGDGFLNLVAASIQDAAYFPDGQAAQRKNRSTLYAWDLSVHYRPESVPWPMLQGNPQHNGWLRPKPRTNQPPVVRVIPSQTIAVGGTFRAIDLDRFVQDPDDPSPSLTWTARGMQALSVQIEGARAIVQAPAVDWEGEEWIEFQVADPAGAAVSVSVRFSARVGFIPPIAQPDVAVIAEDETIDLPVLANDHDPRGGPLELLSVGRAGFGTAQIRPGGLIRYTPHADFHGADSFEYFVMDQEGGVAGALVNLTVTPVDDPPVAVADEVVTDEDQPITVDVLANDWDPDGDPIEVASVSQPGHGEAVRVEGGLIRYLPETNYFGLDRFTYVIRDSSGLTATNAVILRLNGVDDPPVALDQEFALNRNTFVSVNLLATDPDGQTLTFRVVDGPAHGELFNYPTVAVYYPQKSFGGDDRFTYLASDGGRESGIATVRLRVVDTNNVPKVQDAVITTRLNQSVTLPVGAIDDDDDPLTFEIVDQPLHGELSGAGTNTVYRPSPDFLGEDLVRYRALDGEAASDLATITIRVTDTNSPPVARDSRVTVAVNTSTNIVVSAIDGESTPLSFSLVLPPLRGSLAGSGPDFVYTPVTNYTGMDRFTFTASDGEAESGPGTVIIQVRSTNQPPVVTNQWVRLQHPGGLTFRLRAKDAEGDPLQVVILQGPQHGIVFGAGMLVTYLPTEGYYGPDHFTYRVWDGEAYSRSATVSVRVDEVEPAPALLGPGIRLQEDGQLILTLPGEPGRFYWLEASSDLVGWDPLWAGTLASATLEFIDTEAGEAAFRFYRWRSVSPDSGAEN